MNQKNVGLLAPGGSEMTPDFLAVRFLSTCIFWVVAGKSLVCEIPLNQKTIVIVIPRVPASTFILQTFPKHPIWRIDPSNPLRRYKIRQSKQNEKNGWNAHPQVQPSHQQLALGGFYPPAFLPLVLGFVVTSVETVGDIQATCDVSGLPLEGPDADSRIQGGRGEGECQAMFGWRYVKPFLLELSCRWGLLADGLNSILAVLMTSPPNTTFSQNNGVIAITRCASRAAGIACCIWLILSHSHCLV